MLSLVVMAGSPAKPMMVTAARAAMMIQRYRIWKAPVYRALFHRFAVCPRAP
jgi:hypothetical protein